MPLTSHTQGFAAQVNRLRSSVRVGMATTFLIVSFVFLLQFSFEQWPVEATRCLESSLGQTPYAPVDISSHQTAVSLLPSKQEKSLQAGGELLKIQEHGVGGRLETI